MYQHWASKQRHCYDGISKTLKRRIQFPFQFLNYRITHAHITSKQINTPGSTPFGIPIENIAYAVTIHHWVKLYLNVRWKWITSGELAVKSQGVAKWQWRNGSGEWRNGCLQWRFGVAIWRSGEMTDNHNNYSGEVTQGGLIPRVAPVGLAWQILFKLGTTCWASADQHKLWGRVSFWNGNHHLFSIHFPTKSKKSDLQQATLQPAEEGAHRACSQGPLPGHLQQAISCSKKDGRSTSCNRCVHSQPISGGAAQSIKVAIQARECAVSIDIKDAYLHVPMCLAVRWFLRFCVNKHTYQFMCLPFGLATSPWEFTKLLRPVVCLLCRQ